MISGFIAQKLNMSSIFSADGRQIAVTRLNALPLKVTQTQGSAIQVAYGLKKRWNKATKTKLEKIDKDLSPLAFKEFNAVDPSALKLGSEIKVDQVFSVGDQVKVTGISKGRGFAGVIKRHGFHRQPVTGGQSDRVRAPGAIGAQTPGKVVKGKKMPGHLGHTRKTIAGLQILAIDTNQNQILLSGSVPGPIKSWLIIQKQNLR